MVALAREGNLRILGPNTIGVSDAFSGFTSSFIEAHRETTPVGLISQSGLFMMGHNLVANEPQTVGRIDTILNMSFGMLGINSAVVVRKLRA